MPFFCSLYCLLIANGTRINRRDAQDYRTGEAGQKSPNDARPDTTDGKYTLPTDATQAPDDLERGAVGDRVQRLVMPPIAS